MFRAAFMATSRLGLPADEAATAMLQLLRESFEVGARLSPAAHSLQLFSAGPENPHSQAAASVQVVQAGSCWGTALPVSSIVQ